jgi:potassium efflux system protein
MIIRFLLLLFLSITFQSALASSVPLQTPLLQAANQQLAVEQARNALFASRLQVLRQHMKQKPSQVDNALLQRVDLTITSIQQELDGLNLTFSAAQQADVLTQNSIQVLQGELQSSDLLLAAPGSQSEQALTRLQMRLQEDQMLGKLQNERVKILQSTQGLANQTLEALKEWRGQLQAVYQLDQQLLQQKALDTLATHLQQQQQEWLKRLTQLTQDLKQNHADDVLDGATYIQLEIGILQAEENANLSQIQLDLARIRNGVESLAFVPMQVHSVTMLNLAQQQTGTLLQSLTNMNAMLTNRIGLLQQRKQEIARELRSGTYSADIGASSFAIVDGLLASYRAQQNSVTSLINKVNTYQAAIAQTLTRQLASRQGVPGFDRMAWFLLGEKLRQIPPLTWQVIHGLDKPLWSAIKAAAAWQWLVLLVIIAGWSMMWMRLRPYLVFVVNSLSGHRDSFLTNQVLLIGLRLINKHLTELILLTAFIGILMTLAVPLATFQFVIDLFVVVLVFRIIISLARLLLLESTTDKGGYDVRLYYRLRKILAVGAVVTFVAVLVHHLPVAFDVQDLFGRLFMLFLLVISLVLLRSWFGLPALLGPYLENRGTYLLQMVRWVTLLVPLGIFSNALIGLLGYVELAWSIAAYQGIFLLVLMGYLLVSGLLDELMRFLGERMIRHIRNGWLWSEALLKPLHWVLRVILILVAITMLFALYNWNQQSWVVIHINDFLNFKLFSFGGSVIRPLNIIQLIIIGAIFVWATKWTREFTYRWLFARIKDYGLRNSLAIFSQYTMVAFGVFIALRISGINLTALTVVASMFTLGIGFGLRDLANNFMSGILLLVERPVKVGDYVTIGTYEGEIRHIGMRSITVMTDDHQELLVPNANVFSQSFINWTHFDNVVRTVIKLRFNRIDDPHRIKEIIEDVLRSVPKVLTKPPIEVYLKDMDEVLLKFQVGYYVDMRSIDSLSGMRSQVLYALWDRFQAEGIQPPEAIHEIAIHGEGLKK